MTLFRAGQLQDPRVERPRRGEVSAERLLHDDATEAAFPLRREAGRREPFDDRAEEARRGRQVEDGIAPIVLTKPIAEAAIGVRILEIAGEVAQDRKSTRLNSSH